MKKYILGIKIDDITMDQALEKVEGWLNRQEKPFDKAQGHGHYIVTPNPEIVVMAQTDEELRRIINQADLSIPDGKGLRLSGDIVCNIPGIDLMEALIKKASESGFTVGLLGGRDKVAELASERLQKKYPKLKVVVAESGGEVDENGNVIPADARLAKRAGIQLETRTSDSLLDLRLRGDDKVDILFVAFGPPKQEKWIAKNIQALDVRVVMAVGGAFDYLSHSIPRAPKLLRDLNLEWLFRLIIQPWRIKRQMALIKYLWLILRHR